VREQDEALMTGEVKWDEVSASWHVGPHAKAELRAIEMARGTTCEPAPGKSRPGDIVFCRWVDLLDF
jgi:hypothetical protein